jgi:HAE1 family hydrophobic/amphiphilic exporter-1
MKLSKQSVRHPIGVTMIMLMVVIFGFISLYKLPVDLMPDMTFPMISVSATYENASPTEVETLITRPIEQAIAAVSGVEEIESSSSEGRSNVRISFAWGTNLDAATNDVRDRIDRIIKRLPDDIDRPQIRKFDSNAMPIMVLGASADLDPVKLLDLIDNQVKYRIEKIDGVASIDVMGGNQREIQVNLDINKAKALKISPEQIISRIRAENINLPAGMIESGNFEIRLRTPGEFQTVEQISRLVVGMNGQHVIRLCDVAKVEDHWEKKRSVVRINDKEGVRISVSKQSGANTVNVAKAVKKEVAAINEEIPQLRLTPIVDSSKYITRSINNVSQSAILGGILAIVILQIFLANLASTTIIAIAIPVSIIATFTLMYYFGFTLNIMSLGGVALGIGMLVDNSIVVLENIFRHRENGVPIIEASIEGSSEVAMSILASTLTTVVIFLPLLFVEGVTGVMFKQLAYIVAFSLFCSMVISLTIVPMMTSIFLKNVVTKEEKATHSVGLFKRMSDALVGVILKIQSWALNKVLNNRVTTFFVLGCLIAFACSLINLMGTEFMPTADEGEVRVSVEMEEGSRLSLVDETFKKVEKVIQEKVPERDIMFTNVGGGRNSAVNKGDIRIPLKASNERTRSSAQIAAALRKELGGIPGTVIRTREGQGMFMMRMGSGSDKVQLEIRGYDIETADALGAQVAKLIKEVPGITDVKLSREKGVPERSIIIDRDKAADQKLTINAISTFLETMMSGRSAGNLRDGSNEYKILVKATDAEYMKLDEILNMVITNSAGKPVMLRNVAKLESKMGPTIIERHNQERILTLSADVEGRSLGFVIKDVQEKIKEIPLPENFAIVMTGDYEDQQEAFMELAFSFVLAIFLVYMVMAIQYESLRDPFIVMTTVPLSVIGVVPILYFTGTTFNVQTFIGCIMLGGIVVNNSILLVDHMNELRRKNPDMNIIDAAKEAASNRCRPILMTASTTILGLVPLALGWGEGGEMQAPMARAVISGLTIATFISLLIIPLIYIEFDKAFGRKKSVEA